MRERAGGVSVEYVEAGELRFEVHCAGDPESDRLALCLHGFPEHAHSWRMQLPMLADLGYRVWAPNLRGYGGTTPRRPEVAFYHRDRLLADVAALIDAAGARSTTLLGHDWGGGLAWFFALAGMRPLERLVVLNFPHPTRFHEHLRSNPAQRKRSRYERFFQLPWLPERLLGLRGAAPIARIFSTQLLDPTHMTEADIAVYRENAAAPGALTAMLNWYRANPFREALAGAFPVLETPTLMVWGNRDVALGNELTLGTEELVRDYTIRYLQASHWVQQDRPEETNTIVSCWLRGEPVPEYASVD